MTGDALAERARVRRDTLRAEGACINGRTHETPRDGFDKCDWCRMVHRIGVAMTAALKGDLRPTPPRGWKPRAAPRPSRW